MIPGKYYIFSGKPLLKPIMAAIYAGNGEMTVDVIDMYILKNKKSLKMFKNDVLSDYRKKDNPEVLL